MALIDDLKSIDVSAIVDARTAIQAAINSPALTSALEGGAATTALGELGTLIEGVKAGDPAELVRPLARGLGDLHAHFDFDTLPVGKYATAITDGLGVVGTLTAGFDGDFSKLGSAFGVSLDDVLTRAHGGAGAVLASVHGGGGAIWSLMAEVERGGVTSPDAVVDLLLRALLPLPTGSLGQLRATVSTLQAGAGAIVLPKQRADGLVAAFARVEAAALAHDAVALGQALRFLEQVRVSTLGSLRDDLGLVGAQVRKLDLTALTAPLGRADKELRGLAEGLLDQVARWRDMIAMMRRGVDSFDASAIPAFVDSCVEEVETFIKDTVLAFIDEQVRRAVEWMRSLFRHIPIAAIRAELTAFLHRIAKAIAAADIGRYARDAHAMLERLRGLVSPDAIKAEIQKALAAVGAAIDTALDEVIGKLALVKDAVEAVAAQAAAVIGQIVPALMTFNEAVIEIKAGAADVGLEKAGQQVVEQLETLREAAEELLTQAPLPDSLKEQVANVVEFVRGIDLDAAFAPVREAASQLTLPEDVAAAVDSGLAEAATVIDNIVPARLVEGIEADLHTALERIANFDPGALLPDMQGFLDEAATAVEKLTPPAALAAELHAPFQKLLDLIDAAHPAKLLAPAIEAFDRALASVPMPSADGAAGSAVNFVTTLGERAANALIAPLEALVGGGSASPANSGGSGANAGQTGAGTGTSSGGSGSTSAAPAAGAASPGAVPPANLRPGDIIRFLGYIPNELRALLRKLESGTLGQVMTRLDSLTAGLARDLRAASHALGEVDLRLQAGLHEMLAPLADHQVRAQLTVRASFGPGEIDVDGTMRALALAGPGALRHELGAAIRLTREATAQVSATLSHTLGLQLIRTADALDRCTLARLAGDVDGLLAALDPEPIAAEIDALFLAVLTKAPQVIEAIGAAVKGAVTRLRDLFNAFNPGVLAQRFLVVLDVIREQVDALSPRRLAAELGEIHAVIRATIASFDPGAFVTDLAATVAAVAASLRALNPATLVGEITFLKDAVARLEAAVPTKALEGVGTDLDALASQIAYIDLDALMEAVRTLGPQVVDEAEKAATALKQEVIALLESLKYAGSSASASVEVHA